jgi:peroxiredoxin
MARVDVGAVAPDLGPPLADAEGVARSVAAAVAAGPVVLGIYKSSCEASKTMFPFLERLHRRHGGRLAVFGVSQDSANIARSFARRTGTTFPILIEPSGYPVSRAFAIAETPTVYLIRAGGEIVFATSGFADDQVNALAAAVAAELAEPAAPLYTAEDAGVPPRVPG